MTILLDSVGTIYDIPCAPRTTRRTRVDAQSTSSTHSPQTKHTYWRVTEQRGTGAAPLSSAVPPDEEREARR